MEHPKPGKFYCIGADVAEGLTHGDYSCGRLVMKILISWQGGMDT